MPDRLIVLSALASLLVLFLLAPILAIFLTADPKTLSNTLFIDPVLSDEAWRALEVTITASILSTSILLALSIPLAYFLVRSNSPLKGLIEALVDIPLMLPHAVAGIMLLVAYGRGGLLNKILPGLGGIEDAFLGIVAVMIFVSSPIMVDTIKVSMSKISPELEIVARSLGASHIKTFFHIVLPLSLNGIISGSILAWARAVSEVGAILVVAYYPKTINVLVIEWFNTYGLRYAASLSLLMVVISLAVFTALRMVVRK